MAHRTRLEIPGVATLAALCLSLACGGVDSSSGRDAVADATDAPTDSQDATWPDTALGGAGGHSIGGVGGQPIGGAGGSGGAAGAIAGTAGSGGAAGAAGTGGTAGDASAGAAGQSAGNSGSGGAGGCNTATGCCKDLDCPDSCQRCAPSHTCVPVISADDPTARCTGSCDATGICRSKRGQSCTATATGCLADSPCSPDGVCCNQACTGSCLACDVPGSVGTCVPIAGPPRGPRAACAGSGTVCGGVCDNRADGACVYPTVACGPGPTCSAGTLMPQGLCAWGTCTAAPQACPNGCTAAANACAEFTAFPLPRTDCNPHRIVNGPDGNLWFTEPGCNKIGRITVTGAITEFDVPSPDAFPAGIAAVPDGNLWFSEFNLRTLGRISPSGVLTEIPYGDDGTFHGSAGLAVSSTGSLWITGLNRSVGRATTAGAVTWYPLPTENSSPYGITAGRDGDMWFVEQTTGNVGHVTPAGVITEFPVVAPLATSSGAVLRSIVMGPDGNLWFTEMANNAIGRMSPDGLSVKHFPVLTPDSDVDDITVGPDGNLWFTAYHGGHIGRVTPSGTVTELAVPEAGGLSGIVVGPDGNLWFTDVDWMANGNGNSIHRFTM